MAKTELIFYVSLSFISATVLIGGMMIVLNIIHTHRVFGALYAIEQKLRTLKQDGKIEKITSRKFDQSGDIVQLLNEILAQSTATSEKKLDS